MVGKSVNPAKKAKPSKKTVTSKKLTPVAKQSVPVIVPPTKTKLSAAELKRRALEYHRYPKPGKIGIEVTKDVYTADDLSLAYSPGVAAPCREIVKDPEASYLYTTRGNLVGIISNGSAVLGLGNVGALASKPVMEGKAMLFKKFAGIDVFDIELNVTRPETFIENVLALSCTFGAINLEDIAAPGCFVIEEQLSQQLNIPVMHDDQTGTGVVVCAALQNALKVQLKKPCDIKIVCIGAGAAGIGVLKMLRQFFGISASQIFLFDSKGLVSTDRGNLHPSKAAFAQTPNLAKKSMLNLIKGADVIIGVSGPGTVTAEMIKVLAAKPLVFALANPDPEITPEEVISVRKDAIIGTGRSDYPNQINNSICYPYLFRGALNARAKKFTEEMYAAAIRSLADLATKSVSEELKQLYPYETMEFGPNYILPKQNDNRLIEVVAPAVTQAYNEDDLPK